MPGDVFFAVFISRMCKNQIQGEQALVLVVTAQSVY